MLGYNKANAISVAVIRADNVGLAGAEPAATEFCLFMMEVKAFHHKVIGNERLIAL